MNNKRIQRLIFISSMLFCPFFVQANTTYSTGPYQNRQYDEKTLSIPDAEAIEITIFGETEKDYDFIIIYNDKSEEIERFTGTLREKLIIKGNQIDVVFKADNRTTKSGVTVEIVASSLLNFIKSEFVSTTDVILTHGSEEAYQAIRQHIVNLRKLHSTFIDIDETKIDAALKKLIPELFDTAQTYKSLSTKQDEIIAEYQIQLDKIAILQDDTLNHIEFIKQRQGKRQQVLEGEKSQLTLSDNTANNRQRSQILVNAYSKMLASIGKELDLWNNFYRTQGLLEAKLIEYVEKIKILLFFLQTNAELYERFAQLATISTNEVLALNDLTDISQLANIMHEIEIIEADIQKYMKTLGITQL